MDVSLTKVQPLLARPLSEAQTPRVEGWLAALKVLLERRYKDALTLEVEPLFLVFVADAVQRRLDKVRQQVSSEGAGSLNVSWAPASSLGGWFLPSELAEMDGVTVGSGTRTYRTPAPDHIRFNNRLRWVDRDVHLYPFIAGADNEWL